MKKVVFIGIDGFDPGLAELLLQKGELPGFAALAKRGGWDRLQTTNPALSPTAWSTIATGCNPGYHGLFDFIYRETGGYLPRLSITRPNLRNYFGNRRSAFLPARQAEAFWTASSAQKIPTTVIKWPVSFPPEPVSGAMLSGLGVPDIAGTSGRYTYYATSPAAAAEKSRGDVLRLPSKGPRIETILIGPEGVTVPIVIHVKPDGQAAVDVQGMSVPLLVKTWSSWIAVAFHRFGFPAIKGIFRFYLESLDPEVCLYAGALHMDPREPPFPISAPASYSRDLAEALGAFHTLGLPEETNGLVDGVLSEDAFLQNAENVYQERAAMFDHEWNRFREGLFVFVFDTLDRIQHAMWSGLADSSTQNPEARRRMAIVSDHYRRLDRVIARVMKSLADDDLLLVASDHGFSTFDQMLHVNSWLRDEGYLVLQGGSEGLPLFENVDWGKTQAYALGFASLYVNVRKRESEGIVAAEDVDSLKRQLTEKLLGWRDPANGAGVLQAVYDSRKLYRGPCVDQAPDLVLAPRAGCRVSWQTGYGAAPRACVEKNERAWRADHIVDPSFVPGAVFSSRPLRADRPAAADIAPTLLKALDVAASSPMEGRSLV